MHDLGSALAIAIAEKDEEGVLALLVPGIDFRGLTPGRPWEASTAEEVVDLVFGSWFDESEEITALLGVEIGDPVEDTHRVGYRLAVRTPDGDHVVEQQAYYRTDGEQITHLRSPSVSSPSHSARPGRRSTCRTGAGHPVECDPFDIL